MDPDSLCGIRVSLRAFPKVLACPECCHGRCGSVREARTILLILSRSDCAARVAGKSTRAMTAAREAGNSTRAVTAVRVAGNSTRAMPVLHVRLVTLNVL